MDQALARARRVIISASDGSVRFYAGAAEAQAERILAALERDGLVIVPRDQWAGDSCPWNESLATADTQRAPPPVEELDL